MSAPLEVFCCYAREDQEMLAHLKKHLVPLERQGQITIWSDTNLNAGVEWEKELHQHLESADIILLLISPDFMASDYCYSTEMGRSISRHNEGSTQVIPILLRSTFRQNAPFVPLQIVPTTAKPVTNWLHEDDAFHDVTIQINRVVSELHTRRAPVEVRESALTPREQTSSPKTPPASQHLLETNMPVQQPITPLPRTLFERPKDIEILNTLYDTTKIWAVALSANGQTLASCGVDGTAKLWNVQTDQLLRTLTGHRAYGVALSADGLTLASGGEDRTIKLWNVQTGQLLHTLTGIGRAYIQDNNKSVSGVALSANGQTLASFATDGTIMLWNAQTGQLLHTFTEPPSPGGRLALSTDGQILASGTWRDAPIKLWNTQTG